MLQRVHFPYDTGDCTEPATWRPTLLPWQERIDLDEELPEWIEGRDY